MQEFHDRDSKRAVFLQQLKEGSMELIVFHDKGLELLWAKEVHGIEFENHGWMEAD